jgi:hypothetical protein
MSAYRDPVEALAARQVALTSELADKTRELESATQLLEEARAKARLPILDNIRVAAPCPADWAQMTGDDRVRACGSCQKNVYNLSELTRDEAEALIREKNGDLCGRYFQRKDGTIILKDCEIGVSRNRKRRVIAAAGAALLGSAGALFAARARVHEEPPQMIQGGLSAEPMIEVGIEEPKVSVPPELPEQQFMMGAIAMRPSTEEAVAKLKIRRQELAEAKRKVEKARAALVEHDQRMRGENHEAAETEASEPSPLDPFAQLAE